MTLVPIFETTELTVYGGPDTISVVTDLGPKGDRGSLIFTNLGSPDIYTSSVDGIYQLSSVILRTRDMYYRVDNDSWYQWTGTQWQLRSGIKKFFKINDDVVFTSGAGTATIPVSSLWGDVDIQSITADNVMVVLSAVDSDATFVTVTNKYLDGLVPQSFVIDMKGFYINLGNASVNLLNSTVSVDMIISLV